MVWVKLAARSSMSLPSLARYSSNMSLQKADKFFGTTSELGQPSGLEDDGESEGTNFSLQPLIWVKSVVLPVLKKPTLESLVLDIKRVEVEVDEHLGTAGQ